MTDPETETNTHTDADTTPPISAEPTDATPDIDTLGPNADGLPKRLKGTRVAQDDIPNTAVDRTVPGRIDIALERAKICARIADDNRAKEILVLDLRGGTPLIDFFVIASAASRRQAASIAYEIDADMKKLNEKKMGMEGAEEGRWTLIDYGDFVVHVFSEEARGYFGLEEIWGDAPRIDWRDPSRIKGSPQNS